MAKYAELPDGTRLEFPDNVKESVMDAVVAQHMAQMVKPQVEGAGVGRSLGLGARNVLEGVGGVASSIANPVLNALDWMSGGTGTRFKNVGTAASDILGLPTPKTGDERFRSAVIEGASSALPTLGAGAAMQGAAKLPAGLQQLGRILAEMPKTQLAAGASGGASLGLAQESNASPLNQTLAALAGGVAAPLAVGTGAQIASRIARPTLNRFDKITQAGQERLAGTILEDLATDPVAAREALQRGGGVLVEGSQPTSAQLTGDAGLALAEKSLQSSPLGGDIRARYTAQQDAQREALNNLLDPVQQRQRAAMQQVADDLASAAPYGAALDDFTAGGMMRGDFENQYGAMRQRVGEAYRNIDPEGTAYFDLRPLVEKFENEFGNRPLLSIPDEVRQTMKIIKDKIDNGQNFTYQDVQDARTVIDNVSFKAASSGDRVGKMISTKILKDLDDYLERSAMNPELMGGAPTPKAGSAAYREAGKTARAVVDEDAWYDDLQYLGSQGLNREAVERIVGRAGVDDLNRMYPNLVRPSGKLMPDTATSDLQSFRSLIEETGGGTYHADADSFLQALSERLGGMYGRKRQSVDNIRQDIMRNEAVPHTGFTPEQAQAFRDAKALRVQQGKRFEQGANEVLTRRGSQLEGEAIADSAIPSNYFSKGHEGMEAFHRSIGGQGPSRLAMADYVVKNAINASTDASGIINPQRLSAWFKNNNAALSNLDNAEIVQALERALEAQTRNVAAQQGLASVARRDAAGNWKLQKSARQFPEIPASAGLSADETARLSASQQDLKRVLDTANMAAVNGSPTAQLLALQRQIEGVPLSFGGRAGQLVGAVTDFITGGANDNVRRMLVQSVLDPEYAYKLMQNTNNMRGTGLFDSIRRWTGRQTKESFAEALKRLGVPVSIGGTRPLSSVEQ